jgi:hypothetical protein
VATFFDQLVQRAWEPETTLRPRALSQFETPREIGVAAVEPIERAPERAAGVEPPAGFMAGDRAGAAGPRVPAAGPRTGSERITRGRRPSRRGLEPADEGPLPATPTTESAPATPVIAPVTRRPPRRVVERPEHADETARETPAASDDSGSSHERRGRRASSVIGSAARGETSAPEQRIIPSFTNEPSMRPRTDVTSPAAEPAASRVHGREPHAETIPLLDDGVTARDRAGAQAEPANRNANRIVALFPSEPARQPDADTPQVIQVTIGRVEIRATVASRPEKKSALKAPALSLDAYLNQRNGGGQ